MNLVGIARLGRDAELRYANENGTAVVNMSLAFNWGLKGPDGKRLSQWVECAYWGDRAAKAQPYLAKGSQIYVVLSDPHIETFKKRDGTEGYKLAARVDSLEFAGSAPERTNDAELAPKPETKPSPAPRTGMGGIQDMESDIPFANPYRGRLCYVV
jgi:single-strand DNA-binding protein